ncbi:hypothetical protein GCM10027403_29610 [Arthrobacter tecti]
MRSRFLPLATAGALLVGAVTMNSPALAVNQTDDLKNSGTTDLIAPNTTTPNADPSPHLPPGKKRFLERPQPAAQALDKLALSLPEVAKLNGQSVAQLRSLAESDETLWLDQSGQALYVEPAIPKDQQDQAGSDHGHEHGNKHRHDVDDASVAALSAAPADAFNLSSLPGAQRTIYLDFNGHQVTGTAFNNSYNNGNPYFADAYDTDGSPSSFSTSERETIVKVWEVVAEDYAALNINVTTKEPEQSAITRSSSTDSIYGTRVVLSPTSYGGSTCSCGGVAYLGVFDSTGSSHEYYQPAWAFTRGVGTGWKNLSEVASHEAGHNLGLNHDGTSATGYYGGHGAWAPIMGVGYNKAITHWSKGEYADANESQDDFAVMASNGAPLRSDDHGNLISAATAMTGSAEGIIHDAGDNDTYSVAHDGGDLTISVDVNPVSANLDVRLELYNSAGTLLQTANPSSGQSSGSVSFGLDATLTRSLPAGTYYPRVRGTGFGDPRTTGYSGYGSVGAYTISATGGDGPQAGDTVSLVAQHSDKCMTVAGGSTSSGALVEQSTCSGVSSQEFELVDAGNGAFNLVAQHSNRCVDVSGASTTNSADILQWSCSSGSNQKFSLVDTGGGYQVVAQHSQKCLDVSGASSADGAKVIQWTCSSGANQRWDLVPA